MTANTAVGLICAAPGAAYLVYLAGSVLRHWRARRRTR